MWIFVPLMQELITSFIAQSKECKLPGIGKFRLMITPAEPDIANQEMVPPVAEFLFTGKEEKTSNELINYISAKKNISSSEAQARIKKWCDEVSSRLKEGEDILLPSLGSLKKGASGNIFFHPQKGITFFEPVSAKRVVHKDSVHSMLVGDRKTNSSAMNVLMNELHNEEQELPRNNFWKIMAISLLAIGLLLLLFYFYQHSFSFSSIGNQGGFTPQEPPATYMTK